MKIEKETLLQMPSYYIRGRKRWQNLGVHVANLNDWQPHSMGSINFGAAIALLIVLSAFCVLIFSPPAHAGGVHKSHSGHHHIK